MSSLRTAIEIALPSCGSVPLPSSSSRTRLFESACLQAAAIFFMCAEKVERDWSIDCSSPMSAKIELNTGRRLPSPQGTAKPLWFNMASRANVFIATVLPPVFAPVMIKTRLPLKNSIVIGTASAPRRGWRALISAGGSSSLQESIKMQSYWRAHFAVAQVWSSCSIIKSASFNSRANGAIFAVKSVKILRISL